ncbi:heavy metal translocating P-type ATPase [Corynebacterium sp. H78]|uniref:heavy metal translocating P-type ATPase n=1 Tax=Corynebacterium sp. H78 TaxID=3133417 RepID=UPI00309DEF74
MSTEMTIHSRSSTAPTATTASAPGRGVKAFFTSADGAIATATLIAIVLHLVLRYGLHYDSWAAHWPLIAMVVVGGIPLTIDVIKGAIKARGGADMLAAMSIIAAVLMGEWLVAAIIVLMLSGGEALEEAASKRASATLDALAKRSPTVAHKLRGTTLADGTDDVHADSITVNDLIVVLPHELSPVDGEVVDGHGSMDESYLTGEPYVVPKSKGSTVISGAINGEAALTIRATAAAKDSRYAKIVGVLREAENNRPPMRRMADRLGAWYTVIALILACLGWAMSGDPSRFLAVLVIATPCPLLIGVPVAIIGAISLSARRGIIIKNPAMLEDVGRVTTVMFDKTGTLTYGRPSVTEVITPHRSAISADEVLAFAAAVEKYSKHPLASAIVREAADRNLEVPEVDTISEHPGQGLIGEVAGRAVRITNRAGLAKFDPQSVVQLPPTAAGMESVILIDDSYAATLQFRDEPRSTASSFIEHLPKKHGVKEMMILSGDREAEVRHLAQQVGIDTVFGGMSPEQKLDMVREKTTEGPTLFLGDGINDAPAMTAASAGVAFGATSDVTSEAADAVVLDSSLERLDDLLHIGTRMRRIALQSVIGGMGLSIIGMILAVFGLFTPIMGAIAQEIIDILAISNAARVGIVRKGLSDFDDK